MRVWFGFFFRGVFLGGFLLFISGAGNSVVSVCSLYIRRGFSFVFLFRSSFGGSRGVSDCFLV